MTQLTQVSIQGDLTVESYPDIHLVLSELIYPLLTSVERDILSFFLKKALEQGERLLRLSYSDIEKGAKRSRTMIRGGLDGIMEKCGLIKQRETGNYSGVKNQYELCLNEGIQVAADRASAIVSLATLLRSGVRIALGKIQSSLFVDESINNDKNENINTSYDTNTYQDTQDNYSEKESYLKEMGINSNQRTRQTILRNPAISVEQVEAWRDYYRLYEEYGIEPFDNGKHPKSMGGWLVTQIEGRNWPADSNLPTDEAELYETELCDTETKKQEANKQEVETQTVGVQEAEKQEVETQEAEDQTELPETVVKPEIEVLPPESEIKDEEQAVEEANQTESPWPEVLTRLEGQLNRNVFQFLTDSELIQTANNQNSDGTDNDQDLPSKWLVKVGSKQAETWLNNRLLTTVKRAVWDVIKQEVELTFTWR